MIYIIRARVANSIQPFYLKIKLFACNDEAKKLLLLD